MRPGRRRNSHAPALALHARALAKPTGSVHRDRRNRASRFRANNGGARGHSSPRGTPDLQLRRPTTGRSAREVFRLARGFVYLSWMLRRLKGAAYAGNSGLTVGAWPPLVSAMVYMRQRARIIQESRRCVDNVRHVARFESKLGGVARGNANGAVDLAGACRRHPQSYGIACLSQPEQCRHGSRVSH
jgi:hypothetical protein